MWFRRLTVILIGVTTLAGAVCVGAAESTFPERRRQYPFAHSNVLYGYKPQRSYSGALTVFAYEDATAIRVVELGTSRVLLEGTVDKWETIELRMTESVAFKVLSDKEVSSLFVVPYMSIYPGMSFVPSRANEGKEFVLYFPGTSGGWGQPYKECIDLFAYEDAHVTVTDAISNSVYWEGSVAAGFYHRLTPPRSRYVVLSTGVLTVQLLGLYDASSFVLDAGQTGCGMEFMFHVLSPGREYGRHSFYEVHAFEDADIKVYHINDPSSPILFDEFHLADGEHLAKIFDYYNDVFRLVSTGEVTVMAGSFQTCAGGVHGPQSIGDMYTTVPSLDGEGLRFSLGLHCPNYAYGGSGFLLVATEDDTKVEVGSSDFDLDRDEWVWLTQPAEGMFFYDIVADKPIIVQTGSIGGDNDFDNIMTYLNGFGERIQLCDPVEPPQMRTQGYWRRQCKDDAHEDICALVDSVHSLADLFDTFDCDSVCDLMRVKPPENDMCRKAKRQFMALLLNIASGKLAVCNCLEDGREVGDVVAEIDSILSGPLDHSICVHAKTLADDLNNGRGIALCDGAVAVAPPRSILPLSCTAKPNPFRGSTRIDYEVRDLSRVQVKVYDVMGRLVEELVDEMQGPGSYGAEWKGSNGGGVKVPIGMYFLRIQVGQKSSTRNLVVIR
jgi:hypothetical protein